MAPEAPAAREPRRRFPAARGRAARHNADARDIRDGGDFCGFIEGDGELERPDNAAVSRRSEKMGGVELKPGGRVEAIERVEDGRVEEGVRSGRREPAFRCGGGGGRGRGRDGGPGGRRAAHRTR